ncbi:TPA: hypothetical protein JL171_001922 [Escherichia coli]|nr:hypothetical protein [Escherichia coli]
MSEINYQALREVAERVIPAMERLLMLPADDDLLSEQELKDYGVDIDALNAFKFLTGPETVLALLEAEPVAWMRDDADGREYNARNEFSGGGGGIPLYATPQVQVVPEEATPENVEMLSGYVSTYKLTDSERDIAAEIWNACRAAMLQGKEE